MISASFRLNPHTFVREFSNYVYLENQASHTRAYLNPEEFKQPGTELLKLLNEAWLIDLENEPNLEERRFTYAHKRENDAKFEAMPSIGHRPDNLPTLNNLQIELTDACNERCIHCYLPNVKKDTAKALSATQVKDILNQYRDMGGLKVVFSGGEILLHKDLFNILEECRRLNLMILLQTNLLALTPSSLQRIKDLDVFNIQVSLYSDKAEIHDAITGRKGSYERTQRNLELLVANDIPALISCPVMDANFSTVRSLHRYAVSLGVDIYFDFMMMAECDGCCDNLDTRLSVEQTREMINFHLESNPAFMEAITNSQTLQEALSKKYARRRIMCSILSASMCIDSDGTVYPCPGWNSLKLGNINTDKLADIWNSEAAQRLRKITVNDFDKCRCCDKHNFCEMCAVYNHNENGNIFNICHRFCEMAEMLRTAVTEKFKTMNPTM